MKKLFLLLSIMAVLLFSGGCGEAASAQEGNAPDETMEAVSTDVIGESESEHEKESLPESTSSQMAQPQEVRETEITGVSIDFEYERMSGKASNQIAIWVEDESGETIKTLFVTDFTASRRGYENREDALKHWVIAADPRDMTDMEIDVISSATPQAGQQHFDWDLTDENGQRVPDGKYYIRLEGTLFWTSNVLYTGILDLMETEPGEIEIAMERSKPENTDNESMIQNVRMNVMAYKNAVDNTANWLGGLEPADALEYMKEHYDEGLVIVEVNTDYWKLETGFTGAMHIPHDQMAERYDEIPSGVPVILHCGAGVVSVPAYETLMENRRDIPQLSYIAGRPPVEEFNEWLEERKTSR